MPTLSACFLLKKAYAEGALALVLYSARLLDEQNTAETEQARQSAEELLALPHARG